MGNLMSIDTSPTAASIDKMVVEAFNKTYYNKINSKVLLIGKNKPQVIHIDFMTRKLKNDVCYIQTDDPLSVMLTWTDFPLMHETFETIERMYSMHGITDLKFIKVGRQGLLLYSSGVSCFIYSNKKY